MDHFQQARFSFLDMLEIAAGRCWWRFPKDRPVHEGKVMPKSRAAIIPKNSFDASLHRLRSIMSRHPTEL
jgi:hypothetical protein